MNSMQDDFPPLRSRSQPQRSGISARAVLGTSVLAFIGGALVVGWLIWNGRIELPREKAPVQAVATLPPPAATTDGKTAPPVDVRVLGWEQRVSGLEQRLARLDLQAAATEGNTSRAEALLVALAARRAIERGVALGYLETQLKLRFADAQPKAVDAVILAGSTPASLDQLSADLDRLAPKLVSSPSEQGGWARISSELANLFVIRRDSAAPGKPVDRLDRAKLLLRSGRLGDAAAEIEAMPGAEVARDWIVAARRHDEGLRALDLIETTALLEPERLKSGEGKPVVQPSPLETPPPAPAPSPEARPGVSI